MTHIIMDEQVGEIYGWRTWNLERDADDTPILRSPYRMTVWDGPVLAADQPPALTERELNPPPPPEKVKGGGGWTALFSLDLTNTHEGEYGIHAWRSRKDLGFTSPFRVVGAVALSGTVIEGDQGYRGERATVAALWLVWPTWTQMTVRSERPEGYKVWRDTLPLSVTDALAGRYQCPVELYRSHLLEGWTP